ncbi:MAG: hypothetical protein FJZ59_07365 [Chlamydiae bacterium]|nr:hypothetical protein [Chlamydiota bacterium]
MIPEKPLGPISSSNFEEGFKKPRARPSPLDLYFESCEKETSDFFKRSPEKPTRNLTEEDFLKADDLSQGVTGAKKIRIKGGEFVLKKPLLTEGYRRNFEQSLDRGNVCHLRVCESEDPLTDFPRKEVLGFRLAKFFGLKVPQTELLTVGPNFCSLQEFYSKEKAESMCARLNVETFQIDFHSAMKTLLFNLVTENIDGHSGNILLVKIDEPSDDEDDLTEFNAIPIDFGLLFPRRSSIYPDEMQLMKKQFHTMFENRTISLKKDIIPFIPPQRDH